MPARRSTVDTKENAMTRIKAFALVAVLAAPAFAAPPGDLPFGAYDPDGDFSTDTEVTIEHVFLPWEDVTLESMYQADAYALERGRGKSGASSFSKLLVR